MEIGISIRLIRKNSNKSQKEFAKEIGITQTYISQIENGKKQPSLDVLYKVSALSNIPLPIVLWYSLEEKDIKPEKRECYRLLKPICDDMIKNLF